MKWAVNARNKVEKKGDLAALSQIKSELVASYAGHPSTTWAPASVFASLGVIRRPISDSMRAPMDCRPFGVESPNRLYSTSGDMIDRWLYRQPKRCCTVRASR